MINLIPHDLRSQRQYARRNRMLLGYIFALVLAAILVAVTMTISLGFVGADEAQLRSTIEDNSAEIAKLESEIKDLNTVSNRLNTADKLYESSVKFSNLIPEIGSLLPQGTVLNSLSLTGGNTDPLSLDVEMTSADLSAVLQKNLVSSELFEAADVNSISSKSTEGIYKYAASVSVSFTGSAEAKRKAAAAAAAAAKAAAEAQESSTGGAQ